MNLLDARRMPDEHLSIIMAAAKGLPIHRILVDGQVVPVIAVQDFLERQTEQQTLATEVLEFLEEEVTGIILVEIN